MLHSRRYTEMLLNRPIFHRPQREPRCFLMASVSGWWQKPVGKRNAFITGPTSTAIRLTVEKDMPMPKVSSPRIANVEALLVELTKVGGLTRMEIHGPEEELAKLREPLAKLNPVFFVLEYGFRQ